MILLSLQMLLALSSLSIEVITPTSKHNISGLQIFQLQIVDAVSGQSILGIKVIINGGTLVTDQFGNANLTYKGAKPRYFNVSVPKTEVYEGYPKETVLGIPSRIRLIPLQHQNYYYNIKFFDAITNKPIVLSCYIYKLKQYIGSWTSNNNGYISFNEENMSTDEIFEIQTQSNIFYSSIKQFYQFYEIGEVIQIKVPKKNTMMMKND